MAVFNLSLIAWLILTFCYLFTASISTIDASWHSPQIVSEKDSLVVDKGGTLNLTCRDRVPVVWATNQPTLLYNNYEEKFDEGQDRPYLANLEIENMNYTNVGYYFCVHNTTENKMKNNTWSPSDHNVSSIYVFVKDVKHLLAKEAEMIMYHPVVNQPFEFPCKPTFPEVKVTLEKHQGDFNVSAYRYIPQKGFVIEKPTVREHTGSYSCDSAFDTYEDSQYVELIVVAHDETLERPKVEVTEYWQKDPIGKHRERMEYYDVEEGSNISLKCSYEHDVLSSRKLTWNMPSSANNESGNHFIFRNVDTGKIMTREHKIVDISSKTDSGEYNCVVTSSNNVQSKPSPVYINVMPHNYSNVSLLPDHAHVLESPKVGENIRWLVMYRAYPEPFFVWKKGDKVLVDSSKTDGDKRYKLEPQMKEGQVFLEISSPTINDIGLYTLEAKIEENDQIIAKDMTHLSFSMPVPPSLPTIDIQPHHAQGIIPKNDTVILICKSQGFPKPNMQLEFKQCFDKENCTEFAPVPEDQGQQWNDLLEINKTEDSEDAVVNKTTTWRGQAHVQGFYKCSATNREGRTQGIEKEFLVTDGPQDIISLEVKVNDEIRQGRNVKVLEGDNVIIQCRGNKMRTSPNLEWTQNDSPLNVTDQPDKTLEQLNTDVSYVSELKIQAIKLDIVYLNFTCQDTKNMSLLANKSIRVNAMEPPAWKERGEPLMTRDKKEMENLTLSCHASGAPEPQLTWYKDDELLVNEADQKHRVVEGSEINFKYLKITDSGKYKCEVVNRAGAISRVMTVTVTDPDALTNTKTIIIFISIGCVLALTIIILSIVYGRKIYLDRKRAYSFRLENQRMFVEGDPDNLNPELGLEEQAELLPYDTKYEVLRDSIIFDKLLGAGAFGRVYSATALNLIPGQPRTKVAVKMMKSRTDTAQLKALRSEVKIMIHIGRHVNIVNLLGACSKDLATKGELLLLVEYCKHGNILDYMRRHRKDFINQITDYDKIDPYITEARMRQRSGSGSRTRTSRGLKYAHLSFNQDSVSYIPGQDPSDDITSQNTWVEPSSPTGSVPPNGHFMDSHRNRTFSGCSSNNNVILSDMTIMTNESSNGGSDGYIGSRSLGPSPITLSSVGLLSWAFQIAKGMEYLAFKKVLHGDLAARNILLTDDNVVKISDFGLAKDIYKNDNYTKKSKTPLPWKWLAPECFRDGVFSTQSDIWSYGVVLWEIFTLGQIPYPGIDFDETFIEKLEKGVRLEQPRYSTHDLYRVMMSCWDSDPINRPSFSQLEGALGEMLGEAERQRYIDLNTPYQMENTASTFLNFLQSPDYEAKVREKTPNLDEDGYEMPFSPSPCGAMALPMPPVLQSPRMTPLQMQYQLDQSDMCSESSYLTMSSPKKMGENVFNFDKDTVDAISKRDSEIQEQFENDSNVGSPQGDNYLLMQKSSPTSVSPVSPTSTVSSYRNGYSNKTIPSRNKLLRTTSQIEKHDSGVYSPTACIQTNPNYVMVNSFGKTDDNNYLTKGGFQEFSPDKQHDYINYDSYSLPRNFLRKHPKDPTYNSEYANVVPNGQVRGRTLSEASSGLGSISEEGSPEFRDKPDYLKSSVLEPAILEEPHQVYVQ